MKDLYQEEKKARAKTGRKYDDAYKILMKPLITEKASVATSANKYIFQVSGRANKIETAKAVEAIYGTKPLKINIIKMRGKSVRYGRILGRRKNWKKAVVTLPAGESIKIYEGV